MTLQPTPQPQHPAHSGEQLASPVPLVTLNLNGQTVSVPKGFTIMQAAQKYNVAIPHYCWHESLSIAGVCRFCLVHVEGRRKLEIACNTEVLEGMVVSSVSDEVKEAHKWALEFHLINHPLDCPICDQAGECGLQDQYMAVGRYPSAMELPKVLKPKGLDVGSHLILDTERCILCSRCVRFEAEVTKTNGLGIFDRGDRAIIGTFEDTKITHGYQENIVDICPVGAFTSKEFRFQQRVWFLSEKSTTCPGCSTGCQISVHGRPDTRRYYRVKPRTSPVNGSWMCDEGRRMFAHLNVEHRLSEVIVDGEHAQTYNGPPLTGNSVLSGWQRGIHQLLDRYFSYPPEDTALLVAASYTCEEYEALFSLCAQKLHVTKVYTWRDDGEDTSAFDGLLLRGDRNPNTEGLRRAMAHHHITPLGGIHDLWKDSQSKCSPKTVIALAPEILRSFSSYHPHLDILAGLDFVSLWTLHFESIKPAPQKLAQYFPMKGFAEKTGTFINGHHQTSPLQESFPSAIFEAKDLKEVCSLISQTVQDRPHVPSFS